MAAPTFRISQKNALFQIVESKGLDATGFIWHGPTEADGGTAWRFTVVGPPHPSHPLNPSDPPRFAFGLSSYAEDLSVGPYHFLFRPHPSRDAGGGDEANWSQVREGFEIWIGAVKSLQTPDYWQEAIQRRMITASVVAEYDTPFTSSELSQIETSFNHAREEISQKRLLSAEDLSDLATQMSRQQQTASTSGRIDWQKTAVQEWIKWVIRRGLESQTAQ